MCFEFNDDYFDFEEPSDEDESCVHACDSRTLKLGTRYYLLPFLTLLLALGVGIMGRDSGQTTQEIAAATAKAAAATAPFGGPGGPAQADELPKMTLTSAWEQSRKFPWETNHRRLRVPQCLRPSAKQGNLERLVCGTVVHRRTYPHL